MRSVSIKMIRLKSSNYGKDEEAGFSDKLVKPHKLTPSGVRGTNC